MKFLQDPIPVDLFVLMLSIFSLTVLIQLYYILIIQRKLAFFNSNQAKSTKTSSALPVSIIIAARNESDNLFKNLPHILGQAYPEFEVIVVNHQSIDNSKDILDVFSKQYSNLKIVELPQDKHLRAGKKLPLTIGIKAAQYEHLLFTDADCKPSSVHWLTKMSGSFSRSKQIILGYGPMTKTKGFLNKLIRFDTAWIGVSYLSLALNKRPYMGVGRNLAYSKTTFFAVNGFKSHYSIESGDDDLFIQEAAKKNNYSIQIDPETYMESPSKEKLSDWINQKARHYTTSVKYMFIKKLLLAIYPVSLILTWFSFVSLVLLGTNSLIICSIMAAFYGLKWWIQGRCLNKLQEKKFALFFPFWDLFYAFFIPVMFALAKNKKKPTW